MVTYYFTHFGEWDSIVKARKSAYSVISDHYKSIKGMSGVTIYRMSSPVDKVEGYVLNFGEKIVYKKDYGATTYFLNSDGTLGKVFQYGADDKRSKMYRKYGPLKR